MRLFSVTFLQSLVFAKVQATQSCCYSIAAALRSPSVLLERVVLSHNTFGAQGVLQIIGSLYPEVLAFFFFFPSKYVQPRHFRCLLKFWISPIQVLSFILLQFFPSICSFSG